MDFQIKALPMEPFADLFELSVDELWKRNVVRQVVSENRGTPCRVSIQDAKIGETVILLNYRHHPDQSPYRATHAIFVRQKAVERKLEVNEGPEVIRARLISLRSFYKDHMMVRADVLPVDDVGAALSDAFEMPDIANVQIHNAKPGCFAASVHRVAPRSSRRATDLDSHCSAVGEELAIVRSRCRGCSRSSGLRSGSLQRKTSLVELELCK